MYNAILNVFSGKSQMPPQARLSSEEIVNRLTLVPAEAVNSISHEIGTIILKRLGNEPLHSNKQAEKFVQLAIQLISEEINLCLRLATSFLESGLVLNLTDYGPIDILYKIKNRMDLDLDLNDVPSKYQIYLNVEKSLSQQKSELVFSVTEVISLKEVSKKTFTLKDNVLNFL